MPIYANSLRKYIVRVDGEIEEINAESPQQVSQLYSSMGITEFQILEEKRLDNQPQKGPALTQPINIVNQDGSTVNMMSIDDLPEEIRPSEEQVKQEYSQPAPQPVNTSEPHRLQAIEKIWKDGNQEFMLKNGELHKRCWKKTTLKELEEKLGCKIKITDSKNIQIQDWEKLGD
tara:strand:+ start:20452 stop:20973 length:522 start_codon:yes stop_codon:yes gene_type:complete